MTAWRTSTSATRVSESRFRPRSPPTKRATKSEAGLARISAGGAELGQLAADLHDRDQVAHLDRLVDVVGHEEDRLGQVLLEAQELVLEPLPDDRVDRAERLVHQHQRRIGGQGPGDADPLALAAGELARDSARDSAPGSRPTRSSSSSGASALRADVPAEQARHDRHVVADGQVREQADLLDHVADAAAQLRSGPRVAMSRPSIRIRPDVGSISRLTILRLVVLPQPDGPTSTQILPAGTEKLRSLTAPGPVSPAVVVLGDVLELDGRAGCTREPARPRTGCRPTWRSP